MTFTRRGMTYPLGLRAMLGYDDDGTWSFDDDQIVIEGFTPWGSPSGGGFGNTVQLDDGTLVSCYGYRGHDDDTHLEAVRWNLPQENR